MARFSVPTTPRARPCRSPSRGSRPRAMAHECRSRRTPSASTATGRRRSRRHRRSGRRSSGPAWASAHSAVAEPPPADGAATFDVGVDVAAFGEAALLITLGERPDRGLTALAHRIAAAIEEIRDSDPALGRPVPAHATVLVPFDPLALDREEAIAR